MIENIGQFLGLARIYVCFTDRMENPPNAKNLLSKHKNSLYIRQMIQVSNSLLKFDGNGVLLDKLD
jgi:hypothetical protein